MKRGILIVDDQKGIRRLLEEFFKREGWTVYVASDGREAIAKTDEVLPGIILMDVKMPGMSGLEASKKILEKHNRLPILMMSAYEEIDIKEEALKAGIRGFIIKPFNIMHLLDVVNQVAREHVF